MIPSDTTDFVKENNDIVYYQRFKAFNMNLLMIWHDNRWQVANYLPWAKLKPIKELNND